MNNGVIGILFFILMFTLIKSDIFDFIPIDVPILVRYTVNSFIETVKEKNKQFYLKEKDFFNLILSEVEILGETDSPNDQLVIIKTLLEQIENKINSNKDEFSKDKKEYEELFNSMKSLFLLGEKTLLNTMMESDINKKLNKNYKDFENYYNLLFSESSEKKDFHDWKKSLEDLFKDDNDDEFNKNNQEKNDRLKPVEPKTWINFDSTVIDTIMKVAIFILVIILLFYGYFLVTKKRLTNKFIENSLFSSKGNKGNVKSKFSFIVNENTPIKMKRDSTENLKIEDNEEKDKKKLEINLEKANLNLNEKNTLTIQNLNGTDNEVLPTSPNYSEDDILTS